MNILFFGDVVARSGRTELIRQLPGLKEKYEADLTIVNGENAAHGKGIIAGIYQELVSAGADVVTTGNHVFSKKDIIRNFGNCPNLLRPLNLPGTQGHGYVIREVCGKKTAVVNVIGSVFMNMETLPAVRMTETLLDTIEADVIVVDFHGETTSEKITFANYFCDRLTAVIGTHTHVQTADERIIRGCAFISDAGMCGPYDSVLGRDTEEVIDRYIRLQNTQFTPSSSPAVICGVLIQTDDTTNRAVRIERIQIRPNDQTD
ncbi:MAG: TIGR00282 family metallophosphoesterase [Solobacterium sp.]|nr:TIGR00282 family metallophosphoesterase [Solobacterium sp.]